MTGPLHYKISTIATSRADDVAYRALRDIATLTADFEDARIIGGHMTSLLLHAFPVDGVDARRTADADAAVSTEVAASGSMHDLLLGAGYVATSGNHYELKESEQLTRAVDLLVPARDAVFRTEVIGDRGFDATPGLGLALAAPPITIDGTVLLTDGQTLTFTARVPPVEHAVVLKAYALRDRRKAKDLADLYRLLMIARAHQEDPAPIGGWKLARSPATGSRLDAATALHAVADRAPQAQMRGLFDEALVTPERFAFLVRTHIARPT